MKKVLYIILSVIILSLSLLTTSCGGGGGGDDDPSSGDGGTSVDVSSVSTAITGSYVFIEGRTVQLYVRWACDHEVTQAEYQAVMGSNPSCFINDPANGDSQGSRPVEYVNWFDAIMYCNKRSSNEGKTPCYAVNGKTNTSQWNYTPHLQREISGEITCDFSANGYRLPTEAEWEYLACGGNTSCVGQTTYSGSNTLSEVAWYASNSDHKTHEVKKKKQNTIGLYDMTGNVWEWCWDWYDSINTNTPSTGAMTGLRRVIRGGGFPSPVDSCSIMYRDSHLPKNSYPQIGFRVVRTAQ